MSCFGLSYLSVMNKSRGAERAESSDYLERFKLFAHQPASVDDQEEILACLHGGLETSKIIIWLVVKLGFSD